MNTEERAANEIYKMADPRKHMLHDNENQYLRRNAFVAGAKWKSGKFKEVVEKEIKRLKAIPVDSQIDILHSTSVEGQLKALNKISRMLSKI